MRKAELAQIGKTVGTRAFPSFAKDRHRGGGHPPTPATPPCVRVRTRRFEIVEPNIGRITKADVGRAFVLVDCQQRVGRSSSAVLGFTPTCRRRAPFPSVLPLVVVEIHDLLAAPFSFGPSFPVSGLAYPLLRLSALECLTSLADVRPTMPSADFCLPARSPEVSSAAFHAQSPDLRSACLMDMDFAVPCLLVPRSRLLSGFCSSTRTFAPRFLQTPIMR